MKDFVADYWLPIVFVCLVTALLLLLSLIGLVGISPLVWAALLAVEILILYYADKERG